MTTIKTFGNPKTFAIRCESVPAVQYAENANKFAICHFIIDNLLLGYRDEVCYLPTWFSQLSRRIRFIKVNRDFLFPKEFHYRNDREIFELILKSNQLEDEFDPNFLYLPQINNEVWFRHSFTMDETLDAYIFYFYLKNEQIHFLIEDRSSGDRNQRSEIFIFSSISLLEFLATAEEALNYLESGYPYLVRHRFNKPT